MTVDSKLTFNRAIGAVRSIESTQSPWQDVLETTQALIGADAGCFMAWNRQTNELQSFVQRGHDHSTEQDYTSYYHRIDVVAQNAQKLRAGQWLSSSWLMSAAEWERQEFYADFLRRHCIGHIFGFALENSADCFVAFAFQCQTENRKLSRHASPRQLLALSSQMRAAYQRRSHAAARSIDAISCVLNSDAESICLVGSGGHLDHYSPKSNPNLYGNHLLRVRANVLQHADAACNHRLTSAIAAVLRDGCRRVIVLPESWGRVHRVLLCPISGPLTSGAQPCVMARVEMRDIFRASPDGLPAQLFSLTPTEARLLMLLFSGHDASECAILLNVALGTVRKQIASILRKTGCHRQSELMRICSMVCN
ncbi:hypothetical protein EN871_27915 [bacterium M00.F.Ca.ET.228.01.1.1]|uniref:helix-turn-helix transcriptional regulator n=1 Tax=Paraburkholderia phenoliruptrix TaxID=252970 RepID=UPI0010931D5D|nr:hypothetical protein [Paraburkholderia phenoliruptrix]TGP40586.1 hypothetical protein EN871_27915 [bacterium M00.F.Ca.ET.228.01.1.1]TGR96669.1 hypothetical protein EN834_27075 [bacterium M00.F.Ca.ET.191.01.1.1]TGT97936.1 hypothetical protein EN798_27080 [bacterium M00.F.Ca.ET.155.01.1.1]MBW0445991.1 hypothetical protein [Paraburkholderia phenoliruptrix]MBW9099993.1 hypothetical protein [Paraburkholderia phenoliruptrix]